MKIKMIVIIGLISLVANSYAQNMEFKKISPDSLIIVTPIVDAAKRDNSSANAFDTELSKKISKELFEILKQKIPNTRYRNVPDLETLSQKDYINITHNYLAWTRSKKIKEFVEAPPVLVQADVKYTLHIAISGYYGPSAYNGIYGNLFVIDNEIKKIIYYDKLSKASAEITDEETLRKITLQLLDKYLAFKPKN